MELNDWRCMSPPCLPWRRLRDMADKPFEAVRSGAARHLARFPFCTESDLLV